MSSTNGERVMMDELLSQLGSEYQPGSNVGNKSYQDLSHLGIDHPSHRRGTQSRVDLILKHCDVKDKLGVDIGCSVGGITISLALEGAHMIGVDLHAPSILVAKEIARRRMVTSSTSWFLGDVVDLRWNAMPDFVVWFSQYMWLTKVHGQQVARKVLGDVGEHVPVLFFETAQKLNDGASGVWLDGVEGVREELMLYGGYDVVVDLGIPEGQRWSWRNVFMASHA